MSLNTASKPRILVVEDEFLIRLTLVEALGDEGFEVLEAETGDAALPMLLGDPAIRLLLTDIQLPGTLDGKRLAEQVRLARPDLPILFMTGRPDHAIAATPIEQYISKPYTLSDMCDTVRGMVAPGT